ncbi:hypothetical protein ACGF0C_02995 [Streptomyces albidoflavus]|uniref:hypothetical protein n=1 Tax=Streptomyces TaxID=1883 RepID=UPI0013E358E4|nr:hypothetical protein [Streptomyces sp. B29(2018)]
METKNTGTDPKTTADRTLLELPGTRRAFAGVRTAVKLYGALSSVALLVVAGAALGGEPVNTFMWMRAALLPLLALVLWRKARDASRGSLPAFGRVKALAHVMPVAVVAGDLIPGVCPPWYAVLQGLCVLPVVGLAVLTRGPALRAVFPGRRARPTPAGR